MIRRISALLLLAAAPGASSGTWSVEDSTAVQTRLERADRLLRRGLRDQAVPLLQEILDGWPDHLVRDPKDPLRFEGAREAVLRLLREGTEETRLAYEAFAAPRAEAALARGTRTGDAAGLDREALRFAAAGAAGARLLLAAADLRLARGEPGPAAADLRVLLREQAGSPAAGPAAVARLARALARTGDRAGLLDLKAASAKDAGAMVRTGEGESALGGILEAALAAAGPAPRPSDTTTLGGGPDRRGLGVAPEPLGTPRWSQANGRFSWTTKDYAQATMVPAVRESLRHAQPVAAALVDGILYFHWSIEVVARDLYTGRERWRYRAPAVPRIDKARTHGSLLTCPAVAGGIVYAPLQVWPEGEVPREFSFADIDIIPHIPVRRLFALDAATGAVLWTHRDGEKFGPLLRGPLRMLNLTSPPLVLGDAVIGAGAVAVQGAGFDAWAIAADRRTGEIRWATLLGHGQQELNLFGRKLKEVPSAAVASDGQRLFVQTNMGFVSCLDPSTGLPLWTRGYRQSEVPLYDNIWNTPERAFTWTGSPPVAAAGLVLVAPADGEDLLALRADTGALAWTVPCRDEKGYNGPHMFRLLGADDQRVFVAGRPSVRAFDLRSGKKLPWEFVFPGADRGEESGGRGILAGGRLFVPTDRAVYALDTGAGAAQVRRDPLGDPRNPSGTGGNLVTTEGASALVRFDAVEAYYREEDVRVRAAALLRDRPGSADALLEAARIYLAAERPADALPLLERALDALESLPPADRDSRRREVRSSLSAIRERAAAGMAAEGRAAEAREAYAAAAGLAPDSAAAAGVLLRGAKAMAELVPARVDHAAALVGILLQSHGEAILEGESEVLEDDPGRSTAAAYALWKLCEWQEGEDAPEKAVATAQGILDRPASDLLLGTSAREKARARIDDLLRLHGTVAYAPLEKKAGEAFEAALRAKDAAALAAVGERWPNSRAAMRASLEEARLRLGKGDAAGVVTSLRGLLARQPDEREAAEAYWLLAEGLLRTGRAPAARSTLQKLARLHGEVLIPVGETRVRAADAVARRLQSDEMKAPPAAAAGLSTASPWQELWSLSSAPGALGRLVEPRGEPLPGGKVLLARGERLEAFDALTGAPAWSATLPECGELPTSAAGVLVFAREQSAAGIDPSTGEELWRVRLNGFAVDAVSVDSVVVLLLADDQSNSGGGWITALDPATGAEAWPRGDVAVPGDAVRLHARAGAVVWDGADTQEPEIRLVSAARGEPLPFTIPVPHPNNEPPAEFLPWASGPLLLRREGAIEAHDPAKGTLTWTWVNPNGSRIHSCAAAEGFVGALDEKGLLHGIDAANGREAWSAPAGKGRIFDLALRGVGGVFYGATLDAANHGGLLLEARNAATGEVKWAAPFSRTPGLVEIVPSGAAVLVKYFGAGVGRTGTAVFEAATGREVDRFEDPDGRLGGEGFDTAAVGGVLVLRNERLVLVRGR